MPNADPSTVLVPLPADSQLYRGVKLLHDPLRNKGAAFTEEERKVLGLQGLLPPGVRTQEQQVTRVLENLARKTNDLERYIFLIGLQDRNETLFYRVLVDHLAELMPLIYTPTVGQACQLYGHILRRSRGLFVSAEDRGRIRDVLCNWPHEDVRILVVTDGERILGLGDLGADGMGIPVGKLSLYSACAGIHPMHCLPVTLDVGTDNEELLEDPLYIGLRRRRLRGQAYDDLVDEFLQAVTDVFPHAIIQLEDFATGNAFRLLAKYRGTYCLFDDDIQGTGSVAMAGLYSALRITKQPLTDMRVLFLGAGEAAIGIGTTLVAALVDAGLPEQEAKEHAWFFDSKGLVVQARSDLAAHKRPFAHVYPFTDNVLDAIEKLHPTALIGATGVAGMFSRPVLESMAAVNERPIVFALSNPTSHAECTAEQAFTWTEGRAIFASGSPFPPVTYGDRVFEPGQGNNAYIFPGVGLGVMACGARCVTDEMFFTAARILASTVSDDDLARGRIYPPLNRIRDVSARIGTAVADVAYARNLASVPRPDDLGAAVRALMFEPDYPDYVNPTPSQVETSDVEPLHPVNSAVTAR